MFAGACLASSLTLVLLTLKVKEVMDTGGCGLSCRTHRPQRTSSGKVELKEKLLLLLLLPDSHMTSTCDIKEHIGPFPYSKPHQL